MTASAMPRPENLAELRSMIARRQVAIAGRLEIVVRYLLDHPADAAFETCQSIARKCNVSTATVDRAAMSFGFEKFAEFRELFRQGLRTAPHESLTSFAPPESAGKRKNHS